MAKPTLYAAILRFSKPQWDGTCGVLVVDRPHEWKPTKKEDAEINEVCERACDLFESDMIKPGQIACFSPYKKPPNNWDQAADKRKAKDLLEHANAGERYCVGLFPKYADYQTHWTVQ